MSNQHHGVTSIEINEGTRTIGTVATATIGLPATSSDADNDYFPEGEITLVTDIDEAIGKAGDQGTLALALEAISKQCKPTVIVSRVATSSDEAEQTNNIIGDYVNGKYTGLKGLEAAKAKFGLRPNIIGAPGFESDVVIAGLVTTAQAVNGFAYAQAPSESKEEAFALRQSFDARELMLLWPDGKSGDSSVLTAAYAMGLRAKIDRDTGWHKTLSNVGINGLTGISHDVTWDLQNPNTDAGYLNANEITTIINEDGFRFWGDRTCSSDPLFAFENYTRNAQIIRDSIAEAHMWAISKGITATTARDIVEGINRKFRDWTANGQLLGGQAWIRKDANGVDVIVGGKLVIDYDYTPIPPLENLTLRQRITDEYALDLIDAIAS